PKRTSKAKPQHPNAPAKRSPSTQSHQQSEVPKPKRTSEAKCQHPNAPAKRCANAQTHQRSEVPTPKPHPPSTNQDTRARRARSDEARSAPPPTKWEAPERTRTV